MRTSSLYDCCSADIFSDNPDLRKAPGLETIFQSPVFLNHAQTACANLDTHNKINGK
jgi:hypothetical protein